MSHDHMDFPFLFTGDSLNDENIPRVVLLVVLPGL
jgi:hypothetical protein